MSLPYPLAELRAHLYSAAVCDALDQLGYPQQAPRVPLLPLTVHGVLMGRCKTTLWAEMWHRDPHPYALELAAVDSCRPDEVLVCAAGGSLHSALWGELLSTAVQARGGVGAIVDGAVRDVVKMKAMGFPVYARATLPYDSRDRNRVIDVDVPVQIGGVRFCPGDLVIADADGVVVVPQEVEEAALRAAWNKVHAENKVRAAIAGGMSAAQAFAEYGVL